MTTTQKSRPPVMSITPAAKARIASMLADRPGVKGLRLGLKTGGCAGMEYTMDWAEEQGPADEVVEDNGATVFIDPMAVMYLLGTEMDYKVDKLSSGFVFNNPNQQGACGCGESVDLSAVPQSALEALGRK